MLNIDWLIVAGVDAVVADAGGHAIFEIKGSCDVFVLKEKINIDVPPSLVFKLVISWTDFF